MSSPRRQEVAAALLLIALFITAVPVRAAAVAPSGPRATIQRLNGEVDRLLRKKTVAGSPEEARIKDEVKRLAAELLDYTELARRALADQWDKLTPKQRIEFVDVFKELIERNYVKQLRTNLDYEVIYGEEKLDGEEARVASTVKIQTKGKKAEAIIEYRMLKNGTRWMVYDVLTDELSLVRNYRSQFQRIISQQGYDGLLKRMKKKLEEQQAEQIEQKG